ncbi:MAG: guanylate kinase [Pseudomonadota bacterium]
MSRRGLLIILSSPSGAGKSTLAQRLRAWDPSIRFSVSATTRPARAGETDGRDYHFVTEPAFRKMVSEGALLEHAHVFGNFYGSPEAPVRAAIDAGLDVLFDIDWQGAQQIQGSVLRDHVLSIFLLPPSISELRRRLINRAKDSDDTIQRRMQKSWDEISHWGAYDYVLINDDLDVTEQSLRTIIASERLRSKQQPGLVTYVRGLQEEFEDGE